MLVVGLTGSIGMGKTTTAGLFAEAGCPVYDADQAVRTVYAGEAAPLVEAAFPGVSRSGEVDRGLLADKVLGNPEALRRLEAIVHPLVRRIETEFLAKSEAAGAPIAVLDIPLLFEQGRAGQMDAVVVATAPAAVQRERVLARPGMTAERFESILARQVPDAEKRARADFLVDTSQGVEHARQAVVNIIDSLRSRAGRNNAGDRGRHRNDGPGPV